MQNWRTFSKTKLKFKRLFSLSRWVKDLSVNEHTRVMNADVGAYRRESGAVARWYSLNTNDHSEKKQPVFLSRFYFCRILIVLPIAMVSELYRRTILLSSLTSSQSSMQIADASVISISAKSPDFKIYSYFKKWTGTWLYILSNLPLVGLSR